MRISEVFLSLQGEGTHVGIPTVFVRLQECNLRCAYPCDTPYALDPAGGEEMSVDEVMKRVRDFKKDGWVEITGGEPLLQLKGVCALVQKLKYEGYFVEIETNGSFDPPEWFRLVDSWNVDIKCPCSGSAYGSFKPRWLKRLRKRDALKFVVGTQEDLNFVRGLLSGAKLRPTILISPMLPSSHISDVLMSPWLQEVWDFCVRNNFRWSFQQHKLAWGNLRGV